MHGFLYGLSLMAFILMAAPAAVGAAEETPQKLVITDHRFEPSAISAPANQVTTIVVENADDTPEEFESNDLKIEKIVGGNHTITVRIPAAPPGAYKFIGEYHAETANGTITVK